jgi:hypothetical protein
LVVRGLIDRAAAARLVLTPHSRAVLDALSWMARFDQPTEPMTLGNMRKPRRGLSTCRRCQEVFLKHTSMLGEKSLYAGAVRVSTFSGDLWRRRYIIA